MAQNYSGLYVFILYSAVIGFLLGAVYEFFRIIRTAARMTGKKAVTNTVYFICDILFFIIAAVISAIFIFYVNNGRIHGIALAGSLLGFLLYYNTVGRLVSLVSGLLIRTLWRFLRLLVSVTVIPMIGLYRNITDRIYSRTVTRRKIKNFKKKGC